MPQLRILQNVQVCGKNSILMFYEGKYNIMEFCLELDTYNQDRFVNRQRDAEISTTH